MSKDVASRLRQSVWEGSVPLEITLAKADCRSYDDSSPYMIQFPRLSYLGLHLDRFHNYFSQYLVLPDVDPSEAWLSCEGVPLKWHYPLGLLYDLYSGARPIQSASSDEEDDEQGEDEDAGEGAFKDSHLPWRLTIHYSDYPDKQLVHLDPKGKVLHDLFMNNVKEADYLRTGSGKSILSLSLSDTTQLWTSIQQHSHTLFHPINTRLQNPPGIPLKHIPIRLYLPQGPKSSAPSPEIERLQRMDPGTLTKEQARELRNYVDGNADLHPGFLRVVQRLVAPRMGGRGEVMTVGRMLHRVVPSVFPSERMGTIALPVLHGAVVPMGVGVEELMRGGCAYADGWLHFGIVMIG